MNKELLKKFLNHSISKSDGKINISVLDMQSESLQDGHKKIIESDYYNIYSRKDDSSELFVLQNKDICVTLIELI